MPRSHRTRAALAAWLLVAVAAGCRDDLPTAVGPDRFPDRARLTSLVLELPAAQFLQVLSQPSGYTGVRDARYGLVAHRFEGELEARSLIQLGAFPDTVVYSVGDTRYEDTEFDFVGGTLVTTVDTATMALTGSATLAVYALAQEWDPATATWTLAVDSGGVRTPWATPGGTLGARLARTTWAPGDTLRRDTVVWELDAAVLRRMADEGIRGIAIVAEEAPTRLQISTMQLRAQIRPGSRPDTTLLRTIGAENGTFIFTPPPPEPAGRLLVGGLTSARVLFRIDLPETVPACPAAAPPTGACAPRPLRDVHLNDVVLLLDPLPVGGFRPLRPLTLRARSVGEPELGMRAPLGPPVGGRPGQPAEAQVQPAFFAGSPETVVLPLTEHVGTIVARSDTTAVSTTLALLVEPEAVSFGFAAFSATPRLRIVYTLPESRNSP